MEEKNLTQVNNMVMVNGILFILKYNVVLCLFFFYYLVTLINGLEKNPKTVAFSLLSVASQ